MPKKFKELEISIPDGKQYYFPNDSISGQVSFRATSDFMVRYITLKLFGIAATKIKAKDANGRQATFRDCYIIFEHKISLCGLGKWYIWQLSSINLLFPV